MKRTLVIAAHPNIHTSTVNKRWIEELSKHPSQITVHQLYKIYPDKQIDI